MSNPAEQHRLCGMLAPCSIAVVGASESSGWSIYTHANLRQGGFSGPLYLINRQGGRIHGEEAVTSLRDLPGPVDLAVVLTGARSLPTIMSDAHAMGIKNLLIVAAGFAEVGEKGRELQEELVARAAGYDQLILGPNNLGYINAWADVYPWCMMMPWPLLRGGVSILSQSGALGVFLLNYCQTRSVGVSHLVSLGNEANVAVDEGIEYLVADDTTRVIALYIESIRNPERFLAACEQALEAGKPVVVYKAGRGERGARLAASHTGGLVGDDRVTDAVFRQSAIIRAESVEDWITTAGILDAYGVLPGRRVAVVTASGAMSGVISDIAYRVGLELPDFAEQTLDELREVLPEFATPQNPLDLTGYVVMDSTLTPRSQAIVARDPNVDVLVVHTWLPRVTDPQPGLVATHASISEIAASGIPVVPMSFFPEDQTAFSREYQAKAGLPFYVESFTLGLPALQHSIWWSERRRSIARRRDVDVDGDVGVIAPPVTCDDWSEHQAAQFLADVGLPVIPARLVGDLDSALEAAEELGYPVSLKISSPDILHKSDIGGVALHLSDADDVRAAFLAVTTAVGKAAPGARADGVLVSPMRAGGVELLIGVIRDETWGPTLAVALGGVWVEVLRDSSLRRLPLRPGDAVEMLGELKGRPLLQGARGGKPADLDRLGRVIETVGAVAVSLGDRLKALEINPLLVDGDHIEVLDAMILWSRYDAMNESLSRMKEHET